MYRVKSCSTVFLASNFLLTSSDTFAVEDVSFSHKTLNKTVSGMIGLLSLTSATSSTSSCRPTACWTCLTSPEPSRNFITGLKLWSSGQSLTTKHDDSYWTLTASVIAVDLYSRPKLGTVGLLAAITHSPWYRALAVSVACFDSRINFHVYVYNYYAVMQASLFYCRPVVN